MKARFEVTNKIKYKALRDSVVLALYWLSERLGLRHLAMDALGVVTKIAPPSALTLLWMPFCQDPPQLQCST